MLSLPSSILTIRSTVEKLRKLSRDYISYQSQQCLKDAQKVYLDTTFLTDADDNAWIKFRESIYEPQAQRRCAAHGQLIHECVELTTDIFRMADIIGVTKISLRPKLLGARTSAIPFDRGFQRTCMPSALVDWAIQNAICRSMVPSETQLLPFLNALSRFSSSKFRKMGKLMFVSQMCNTWQTVQRSQESKHHSDQSFTLRDLFIILQYCRFFDVAHEQLFLYIMQRIYKELKRSRKKMQIRDLFAVNHIEHVEEEISEIEKQAFMLHSAFSSLDFSAAAFDRAMRPVSTNFFQNLSGEMFERSFVCTHFPKELSDSTGAVHIIPKQLSMYAVLYLTNPSEAVSKMQQKAYSHFISAGFKEIEIGIESAAQRVSFVDIVTFDEDTSFQDASFEQRKLVKVFYAMQTEYTQCNNPPAEVKKLSRPVFPQLSLWTLTNLTFYLKCLFRFGADDNIVDLLKDICDLFSNSGANYTTQAITEIEMTIQSVHDEQKDNNVLFFTMHTDIGLSKGAKIICNLLEVIHSKFASKDLPCEAVFGLQKPKNPIFQLLSWICWHSYQSLSDFKRKHLVRQLYYILTTGFFPAAWADRAIAIILRYEYEHNGLFRIRMRKAKLDPRDRQENSKLWIRQGVVVALLYHMRAPAKEAAKKSANGVRFINTSNNVKFGKFVQFLIEKIKENYKRNL